MLEHETLIIDQLTLASYFGKTGIEVAEILYVGNLPASATEQELHAKFSMAGTVSSAVISTDQKTARSRRFALIEMPDRVEAQSAIARLNMTAFDDTVISVSFSRFDQQQEIAEG